MVGVVGSGGVGGEGEVEVEIEVEEGVSANTPLFQRPSVGKPTMAPGVNEDEGEDASATATGIVNLAYPGTCLIAVLRRRSTCLGVRGVSVYVLFLWDLRSVEREYWGWGDILGVVVGST